MEEIDPQALNLAKAIRRTETGTSTDPYNQKGGSGEVGAYQFMPGTYKQYAKKYIGDENAPMTVSNQNKIAYSFIKEKKDAGYTPAQIASMWNAGESKPDAYKSDYKGTNDKGVSYDTPAYVNKVKSAYIEQSQGYNPTPYSAPSETNPGSINYSGVEQPQEIKKDDSLGGQLSGRLNDVSTAITETMGGKINPLSGVIQSAGALAGGLGDVVNAGLGLIPGVKQAEEAVGNVVKDYAQTPGGQSLVKSINDFSTKHPELSKDIGGIINIVSAIPILKGLGVAKNVAMDATSQALKGVAEKAATQGFTKVVSSTIGGRKALATSPNAIKTLVDERALPDIVDGKYNTKDAFETLSNQISDIEDTKLQPLLQNVSTSNVSDRMPLDTLKQQAIADIKGEFKGSGDTLTAIKEIERKFKSYRSEYGDYVTLQDMNDMKRLVRKGVNFNSPAVVSDVAYQMGQTFMKNIETQATKLGLGDVRAINSQMQELIKAQNILKNIEGKSVKTGIVGDLLRTGATGAGESLGAMTGIPFAGAFMGYKGGGLVGKSLTGMSGGILDRTGKNAVKTNMRQIPKKATGLLIGSEAIRANSTNR